MSAREMAIELNDSLAETLRERGIEFDHAFPGRAAVNAFMQAMPSTDVAVALKTAYHRNNSKRWEVNDIHDIDALSIALPYCDVVVTDRQAQRALQMGQTLTRCNTVLMRDLRQLPTVLPR